MTDERPPNGVEREEPPEGWPETYSAAGRAADCPHQMHWDARNQEYHCIYECGEVDQEPPESKIEGTA